MQAAVRDSSEYGWMVIQRSEYERMSAHGYAGTDDEGRVWALLLDKSDGATVLYRGLDIIEPRPREGR